MLVSKVRIRENQITIPKQYSLHSCRSHSFQTQDYNTGIIQQICDSIFKWEERLELSDGSYRIATFYCYYHVLSTYRGNGRSRPPRHLKTKFTPLNRAVRSLSTHPTANLAPAVTSLPTWRGEHLNSPLYLCFSLFLPYTAVYITDF